MKARSLEELPTCRARGNSAFCILHSAFNVHSWYLMVVLSVFHHPTALCAVLPHKTWSNENILSQILQKVNTQTKYILKNANPLVFF